MQETRWRYVGFWVRLVAFAIDVVLLAVAGSALVFALVMGGLLSLESAAPAPAEPAASDGLVAQLLWNLVVAVIVILFWRVKSATPGKMVFSAVIADAKTGGRPTTGKLIGRYFASIASTLFPCAWVSWGSPSIRASRAGTTSSRARWSSGRVRCRDSPSAWDGTGALGGERTRLCARLPAGIIWVGIEAPGGVQTWITMAQKRPRFLRAYPPRAGRGGILPDPGWK